MRITIITLTFYLAATISQFPASLSVSASSQTRDDTITQAIRSLWSRQNQIRAAAKIEILAAGSRAIDPLMSLLSELLDTVTKPNVVAGEERMRSLAGDPLDYEVGEDITWRLIYDCCELLGQLKAHRAVPLLIRVIEIPRIATLMLPRLSPEIKALASIGKPAEAALIEEMGIAFQKAASLVGLRLPDGDERKRSLQEQHAYEIQIQVGAALQLIGDNGTIEALEALLKSDTYMGRSVRSVLEDTITRIRSRQGNR